MAGEELGEQAGHAGVPAGERDAEEEQQQPEGDDERHLDGRAVQPAHEHPLDEGAQQRGHDEDDEDEGQRHRPAVLDRQLPVRERGEHADGAMGEVEDARRDVGDDEAGGGEGVDAAHDQADDRQGQKGRHLRLTLRGA